MYAIKTAVAHAQQVVTRSNLRHDLQNHLVNVGAHFRS